MSANGVFHLHGALYGEKTTRMAVARLMFDSHTEMCRGGKTNLMNYVLKNPPYDEKGETVMDVVGKNDIQIKPHHKSNHRSGKCLRIHLRPVLSIQKILPGSILHNQINPSAPFPGSFKFFGKATPSFAETSSLSISRPDFMASVTGFLPSILS